MLPKKKMQNIKINLMKMIKKYINNMILTIIEKEIYK